MHHPMSKQLLSALAALSPPKFIRQKNKPSLSTSERQCMLLRRLPLITALGSNGLQGPCSHNLDRTMHSSSLHQWTAIKEIERASFPADCVLHRRTSRNVAPSKRVMVPTIDGAETCREDPARQLTTRPTGGGDGGVAEL